MSRRIPRAARPAVEGLEGRALQSSLQNHPAAAEVFVTQPASLVPEGGFHGRSPPY
jgi:hypothetical protein